MSAQMNETKNSKALLPDISSEILELLQTKIEKKKPSSLRASMIGDPCERYLYHSIVDWQLSKEITVQIQGLFELGKFLEHKAKDYLRELGYQVIEQLDYFEENGIRGLADCFISGYAKRLSPNNPFFLKKVPVEIKWLSGSGKKESVWDLLRSEHRWERRYPAQILLYMLFRNSEIGLFLWFEKLTSMPHHFWISFNDEGILEYTEELLKKAERIKVAVEQQIPPERISPSEGWCLDCDFAHVCHPPIWFDKDAKFLNDPKIVELLERREELSVANAEYQKVSKMLNEIFNGIDYAVVGNWIIQGKAVERKGYEVKATTYWSWKAKRIESEPVRKSPEELEEF